MEKQLNLFGGVTGEISKSTQGLENAYHMMFRLDERIDRLSARIQYLWKEIRLLREDCHSIQAKYHGSWKMRKELELLRAEVEMLKENTLSPNCEHEPKATSKTPMRKKK